MTSKICEDLQEAFPTSEYDFKDLLYRFVSMNEFTANKCKSQIDGLKHRGEDLMLENDKIIDGLKHRREGRGGFDVRK